MSGPNNLLITNQCACVEHSFEEYDYIIIVRMLGNKSKGRGGRFVSVASMQIEFYPVTKRRKINKLYIEWPAVAEHDHNNNASAAIHI